jgi:hypothetical protein
MSHPAAMQDEIGTKNCFGLYRNVSFCYCPISTKRAMGEAHVEGVPRVMFKTPRWNARQDRDEKLFCPKKQSTLFLPPKLDQICNLCGECGGSATCDV